jgi:hypothetical protein
LSSRASSQPSCSSPPFCSAAAWRSRRRSSRAAEDSGGHLGRRRRAVLQRANQVDGERVEVTQRDQARGHRQSGGSASPALLVGRSHVRHQARALVLGQRVAEGGVEVLLRVPARTVSAKDDGLGVVVEKVQLGLRRQYLASRPFTWPHRAFSSTKIPLRPCRVADRSSSMRTASFAFRETTGVRALIRSSRGAATAVVPRPRGIISAEPVHLPLDGGGVRA